jgi:hypothetical protein
MAGKRQGTLMAIKLMPIPSRLEYRTIPAMPDSKDAEDPGQSVPDAVVWALCPHIRRWSDPHWNEYAEKTCDRCPETWTHGEHEVVCPYRCDAEAAARAALPALESS